MAHADDEELLAGDEAGGGVEGCESRRKILRERLRAAGGRLDEAAATELAGIEMTAREEKGQALFTAYLQNEVSEEYCNDAARLLGYGQWWGDETRWRIAAVEGWTSDPPAGPPCRLTLECALIPEAGGEPARKSAHLELEVDGELAVSGFLFQWK